MIPIMVFFMAAGVMVADVGLFFSDRRNAQATVDHAARAGAIELTLDPSQTSAAADDKAVQSLTLNNYKNDDVDS